MVEVGNTGVVPTAVSHVGSQFLHIPQHTDERCLRTAVDTNHVLLVVTAFVTAYHQSGIYLGQTFLVGTDVASEYDFGNKVILINGHGVKVARA